MDVQAGLLVLFIAYKAVQDVQRVEEEVWIHLPLQLEIPVLGEVGLFLVCKHLGP